MKVYWIWSLHCPQCKTFADSGVVDVLAQTLYGVRDVWWKQRRVDIIGSTDPSDNAPAPTLTKDDQGRVQPRAVFTQPISDLEEKVDGDLQTPTMLLEHDDVTEEVNPIQQVGKGIFDDLDEEAWSGARSLISKTFVTSRLISPTDH